MNFINNTVGPNDIRKLTGSSRKLWVYSISGTGTELQIATDGSNYVPVKAKVGITLAVPFTEIMVKNTTAGSVDFSFILLGENEEFTDYS